MMKHEKSTYTFPEKIKFAEEIGADGYSADAREAVKVVNRLLEK